MINDLFTLDSNLHVLREGNYLFWVWKEEPDRWCWKVQIPGMKLEGFSRDGEADCIKRARHEIRHTLSVEALLNAALFGSL